MGSELNVLTVRVQGPTGTYSVIVLHIPKAQTENLCAKCIRVVRCVPKNTQNGESECNLHRKAFLHAQNAAGLCVLYPKTPKTENRSAICGGRASFMRKMQPDCAFCTQKRPKRRIGVQFAWEGLPSCAKCSRIVRFVPKNTQNGESRRKGFLHVQNAAGLCVLYAKTPKTENRSAICVGRATFMQNAAGLCVSYAKTPKTDGNLGLRNLGLARV